MSSGRDPFDFNKVVDHLFNDQPFWRSQTVTNPGPAKILIDLSDKDSAQIHLVTELSGGSTVTRKMNVGAAESLISDLQRAIRMVKAAETK